MIRMGKLANDSFRLGVIAVLAGVLCSLVPSALGQSAPEEQPAAALGLYQATAWGAPVLVSPANATALNHYPRTTTLIWQPVSGAVSYLVEAAYFGTTWVAYPPVTVSGNSTSFYSFNFIGDQKGRWRVTAFDGTNYSPASPWWTFSFTTVPQMATPTLTGPANNAVFGQFPRTLTLSWKMVPATAGYKVEIAYCQSDRVTCVNYPVVNLTDPLASDYTFSFVGAQPGKWRVTALGGGTYRDSAPSAWHWFSFTQ